MKKLLFAFFVLTVVLGSISLQAQDQPEAEAELPPMAARSVLDRLA